MTSIKHSAGESQRDSLRHSPPVLQGRFLTAEWRSLAMFNFTVDPGLMKRLVPPGTTLDTFAGQAYVSLVGFKFRRVRVLGIPIPFHREFEEVNLRFYVRREVAGEVRRGVTFIKEIVPRWAVAKLARWCYNENYVALPMWHRLHDVGSGIATERSRVEYGWRERARNYRMSVSLTGACQPLAAESIEQFIAEHYWGYCAQTDGSTYEYQVEHPPWNVWTACRGSLEGDFHSLYGGSFGDVLSGTATSVLVADGSAITVRRPMRI